MDIENSDEALAEDLLWGVAGIAREIKRSERSTLYLLETGKIPAQKVGRLWVGSRSGLRRHFASALAGEVARSPMRPEPKRNPAPRAAGRASETFNCLAALNASENSRPLLDIQAFRLSRPLVFEEPRP